MIERHLSRLYQGLVTISLILLASSKVSSLQNVAVISCFGRTHCGISSASSSSRSFSTLSALGQLRGGNTEEETIVEESEEEEEDEEEEEAMEEESQGPKVTTPLKLKIGTNLIGGSNAIDISPAIELMCSRSRSILSIKQSLSRSLRGRPPMELLQLVDSRTGQTLENEILVQELADDEDDDDDDEEDGDPEVTLYLSMIPPVDPKFGTLLPEQIAKASTQQLLNMYATNVACMNANSNALFRCSNHKDQEAEDELTTTSSNDDDQNNAQLIWDIKQHAMSFKDHIISNLLTEEQRQILQNERLDEGEDEDAHHDSLMGGDVLLKESLKRKGRTAGIKGGATMHVKRALQKNLNIVRTILLSYHTSYHLGKPLLVLTLVKKNICISSPVFLINNDLI